MKTEEKRLPPATSHYRKKLKGQRIKVYREPPLRRACAMGVIVLLFGALILMLTTGTLNFTDKIGPTVLVACVCILVSVPIGLVYFNTNLIMDTKKEQFIINEGFRSFAYPLSAVWKIGNEDRKNIAIYIIKSVKETKTEGGGLIKERQGKRVVFSVSSMKNLDQQLRFEHFMKRCNKILKEYHGEEDAYYFSGDNFR